MFDDVCRQRRDKQYTALSSIITTLHRLSPQLIAQALAARAAVTMASASNMRLSREDHRKQRELNEARKNGELPPEQDEDGNLINPHIPEFMSKAPWYLNQEGPGLKHQKRFRKEHTVVFDGLHTTMKKGFTHRATKFRKGACKNCGAMTHDAKSCVEAPRKLGAWKTNKNIKPDEILPQKLTLSWDGKRDRYSGYDADAHKLTIARFNAAEAERRKFKQQQRDKEFTAKKNEADKQAAGSGGGLAGAGKKKRKKAKQKAGDESKDGSSSSSSDSGSDSDSDADSSTDSENEDVKQKDSTAAVGGDLIRYTTKAKMSVRNLRLREDLPKYLRNLDVDSAYYDPHTRSMRENPNPQLGKDETTFIGDNISRVTGDAVEVSRAQLFCWDANKAGSEEVHLQANPTQAELLRKQFQEKKSSLKKTKKQAILEKYGGQKYLKSMPRELLMGETENYVEYSRDGRVIKGKARAVQKSKYEEDVLVNNHTAVWGSYFDVREMAWGYACCHLMSRNSICTGEAGKAVRKQVVNTQERKMLEAPPEDAERVAEEPPSMKANQLWGENMAPELDEKKLRKALKRANRKERKKFDSDERKRKYNSLESDNVTAEEMEAYRMTKVRANDPMANYVDPEADDAAQQKKSKKRRA